MKPFLLIIAVLSLLVQTVRAQLVEVWPNSYSLTESHQQNVGGLTADWRLESVHTETLSTNSLVITHRVYSTVTHPKTPPTTVSLYEDRTYYARIGGSLYSPFYAEHVTFTQSKSGEVPHVTVVDTSTWSPLTWSPSKSGAKIEGDSSWRFITSATQVECKIINRGSIAMLTKIPCWWTPDSVIVNGFGNFVVTTTAGQTKVVYLNADYFSTVLHPVGFIEFDFDAQIDEPL